MKHEPIPIVYEDNHLIVIKKPPGLLSQKDVSGELDVTELMKEYLRVKYNKPGNIYLGLVHRLDKPVGGLMVVTKTSKAASRLSEDIRKREFKKKYLALVEGELKSGGQIKINIKKNEENLSSTIDQEGKEAFLTYQPLKITPLFTLVEVNLYSGRFHQIRLSMSSIGHPVVNDIKYKAKIKKGPLYLWAYYLSFTHPITKEVLTFIDKPNDWPLMI